MIFINSFFVSGQVTLTTLVQDSQEFLKCFPGMLCGWEYQHLLALVMFYAPFALIKLLLLPGELPDASLSLLSVPQNILCSTLELSHHIKFFNYVIVF